MFLCLLLVKISFALFPYAACNCSFQTSNGNCADGDGQCNCKPNYAGKKCDRCNSGFFNYPICEGTDSIFVYQGVMQYIIDRFAQKFRALMV